MKKLKVILVFLFLFILSSCKFEKKIENEFYSEETLEKFEMVGLPKGNWKDCVVWGNSFYFNINKDEFENWIISIIDYIDSREDVTCWGFAELFQDSCTRDFLVTEYEDANAYLKDHKWISIAFTTMPLQDNTFQNCYYINASDGYDTTLDVKGDKYYYEYYMSLLNKSSYANKYHL